MIFKTCGWKTVRKIGMTISLFYTGVPEKYSLFHAGYRKVGLSIVLPDCIYSKTNYLFCKGVEYVRRQKNENAVSEIGTDLQLSL